MALRSVRIHDVSRELSVGGVLLLILATLALFAPSFFDWQPLLSRTAREIPVWFVASGMALVIICRQIDISVGSQFAVCGVLFGLLAERGWHLALLIPTVAMAGTIYGAFNGWLIAFLRLPAIVVTLATMVIGREGLRWAREGRFVNLPQGTQWFGLEQATGQWVLVLIGLLWIIALAWGFRNIEAGRVVYAVGSNAEAARLAGRQPDWTTFLVFCLLGALTGLASVLNSIQAPQVDPKSGSGLELKVIAAVVVGGVAINGGRGRLWGVFLGLLLLANISPALTYLRVEAYWEKAMHGAIILLAVMADGFKGKRQAKHPTAAVANNTPA